MDPVSSLRNGEEEELAAVIQSEMIELSHDNISVIEDWIESGFRQRCVLILTRLAPQGWVIEEEKSMGNRRADILITAPDGHKIMIELKYVRLSGVVFPDRDRCGWYEQATLAYHWVMGRANILALEVDVYNEADPMRIDDWLEACEFKGSDRAPEGKFRATCEAMEADDAFLMVGVGPRVFTCRPEEIILSR